MKTSATDIVALLKSIFVAEQQNKKMNKTISGFKQRDVNVFFMLSIFLCVVP